MSGMRELEPITFAEFEAMEKTEGLTYEFIDGIVMMSPRPAKNHQRVNFKLTMALWNALQGKGCEPLQEVDLVLDGNNLVPDIMVVRDDELDGKRQEQPPMIVIEILSPSSSTRDHVRKRHKYEELGIKEYWIVSPEEKCITVFDFVNDTHEIYCDDVVKSVVIPDLQIELDNVFV